MWNNQNIVMDKHILNFSWSQLEQVPPTEV